MSGMRDGRLKHGIKKIYYKSGDIGHQRWQRPLDDKCIVTVKKLDTDFFVLLYGNMAVSLT